MRLQDKRILITGGSRGIGRACVENMAAEGGKVAFVYQSNKEAADSLVAEMKEKGFEVEAHQVDVRDYEAVHKLVEKLVEAWDGLDVLVNSAGIVRDGLLGAMTADQWHDVIDTNLNGTFNFCHAVVQTMMYQRSGSIVNISSTSAEFASRGQVNYAASKGGINGMTHGLAKELAARKIRVNAVSPGMIETDMSAAVRGLAGDQIKKSIPLKRVGKAEEVAHLVTFLACDESSYVTGQIVRVDGGLSLGAY